MGSSGGGGGGNPGAMMQAGTPMPGLPIAGQGPGVDAFKYGKFQNFLPEIQAEGENPMATGLRPEMFEYRTPGAAAGSGGGDMSGEIQGLRDQLAQLQAGFDAQKQYGAGTKADGMLPVGFNQMTLAQQQQSGVPSHNIF